MVVVFLLCGVLFLFLIIILRFGEDLVVGGLEKGFWFIEGEFLMIVIVLEFCGVVLLLGSLVILVMVEFVDEDDLDLEWEIFIFFRLLLILMMCGLFLILIIWVWVGVVVVVLVLFKKVDLMLNVFVLFFG